MKLFETRGDEPRIRAARDQRELRDQAVAVVQIEDVIAVFAVDAVAIVGILEIYDIVAYARPDDIAVVLPEPDLVAGTGPDLVIARTALQIVAAVTTKKRVVAGVAVEPVAEFVAYEIVVALVSINLGCEQKVEIDVERAAVIDVDDIYLVVSLKRIYDLAAIGDVSVVACCQIRCHVILLVNSFKATKDLQHVR